MVERTCVCAGVSGAPMLARSTSTPRRLSMAESSVAYSKTPPTVSVVSKIRLRSGEWVMGAAVQASKREWPVILYVAEALIAGAELHVFVDIRWRLVIGAMNLWQ
jgi:hypothetical protein